MYLINKIFPPALVVQPFLYFFFLKIKLSFSIISQIMQIKRKFGYFEIGFSNFPNWMDSVFKDLKKIKNKKITMILYLPDLFSSPFRI